jgi:hypothetical protein
LDRDGQQCALEQHLEDWLASYPSHLRTEFHKDGIVNPERYREERLRLLFVLLEPNSKGGRWDRFQGHDLRHVFGEVGLGKSIDLNLARWTRVLLDGEHEYFSPNAAAAKEQLRRVAIMNLKKLAGSGTANPEAISVHAWRDAAFIRKQVELIQPDLVVTCGPNANRLFGMVLSDDPFRVVPEESVWSHGSVVVLPGNHPAVRPKDAPAAFARLVARSVEWTK